MTVFQVLLLGQRTVSVKFLLMRPSSKWTGEHRISNDFFKSMQDVRNSIDIYTSNCMIVTTAARYLAPYATVELALILINSGQVEEAGILLETAKYGHLGQEFEDDDE